MDASIRKIEVLLRICAVLMLVLTACLVGLDTQTKTIVYTYKKEANYNVMDALRTLVYADTVVGAYNVLQLSRICITGYLNRDKSYTQKNVAWACFLLDQMAVYVAFGWNTAALQAALLAVTGSAPLQWMKLCNRFTRFCIQIGGSMLCGYTAFFFLVAVATISAFNLFRLYSPTKFMQLKQK